MPHPLITRRNALVSVSALGAGLALVGCSKAQSAASTPPPSPVEAAPSRLPIAGLEDLERRAGGRLGVAVLSPGGAVAGHRTDDYFAMCSTFKFALAGIVLREADAGRLDLDKELTVAKADIVSNSPVTERALARGKMTIRDLIRAAQVESDNAAANLVLAEIGGPGFFTAKVHEIGDPVTNLQNEEPRMNDVPKGDLRDSTTPAAMAQTVLTFTVGDALAPASRALLLGWMRETKTGPKRLRAGLPADWAMGHKTGTWRFKVNDIAIAFPPGRPPVAITAYYETADQSPEVSDEEQAVLAEAGRIAAAWVTAA